MQIHELDSYSGQMNGSAFLAVDNGSDTGKVSATDLLKPATDEIAAANARIDNIIAGGAAPSASEIVDARLGANGVTYASLGAAIRGQITNLDDKVNYFDDLSLYQSYVLTSNYRIKSSGLSGSNSSYELLKYAVHAGQKIFVKAIPGSLADDIAFQFQNANNVPSTGTNSNLIGSPYTGYQCGVFEVPAGATWIIISRLKTDTTSGVYISDVKTAAENVNALIDSLNFENYQYSEPNLISEGWELTENGVSRQNSEMELAKYAVAPGSTIVAFLYKFSGSVYQFQSSSNILGPTGAPTFLIGEPQLEPFAGELTVPEGASYLFVSRKKGAKSGVYLPGNEEDTQSEQINPLILTDNLIAHKGGSYGYDGTLNRLKYSFEHGYKILEMDLQFTSDNVPVVQHDSTITAGGQTITINSTTYSELASYDLGDGSHIISLDEAILFCKKRGIVAELDLSNVTMNSERAQRITDIVINRGMIKSVIFTGVATKLAFIIANISNAILSVSNLYDSITTDDIDALVSYKKMSSAVICSINRQNVTESLVNYAHQKGLLVKTWTHTSAATVNADLSIGVDLAICDNGIYPDSFVITD